MSTPTAIEVVRAQNDWWLTHNSFMPPHTRSEYAAAIASVLADAERFRELREAHECGGPMDIQVPDENGENWTRWTGTLRELADRLREGGR